MRIILARRSLNYSSGIYIDNNYLISNIKCRLIDFNKTGYNRLV